MKRRLGQIDVSAPRAAAPQRVRIGEEIAEIQDEGDGGEAARLATLIRAAGGEAVSDPATTPTITVRIGASIVAPRRARGPRPVATVILGSARPAFAERWVASILGDR